MNFNRISQQNFQTLFSASNPDARTTTSLGTPKAVEPESFCTPLEKIALGNDSAVLKAVKWAFTLVYKLGIEPVISSLYGESYRLDDNFNEMNRLGLAEAKNIAEVIRSFNNHLSFATLTSILQNIRAGNKEAEVTIIGDNKMSIVVKFGAVLLKREGQEDEQLMSCKKFISTLMNSVLKDNLVRYWNGINPSTIKEPPKDFKKLVDATEPITRSTKLNSVQRKPAEISKPKLENTLEQKKQEVHHPSYLNDNDDEDSDEILDTGLFSWLDSIFSGVKSQQPNEYSAN